MADKTEEGIHILTVLKWIAATSVIATLAWVAFSHSPTQEQIFALIMSGIFFFLAMENRNATVTITEKLGKVNKLDKLDKLDKLESMEKTLNDIRDILKERLK